MNIIFGKENAEQLREKYTVAELESVVIPGKLITAYCVFTMENWSNDNLLTLNDDMQLHQSLITELNKENYEFVYKAIPHLVGKFGGELDSFYDILLRRERY